MNVNMLRSAGVLLLVAVGSSRVAAESVAVERVLHKEVVVPATLDAAWRAWATAEGLAEFWVPDAKIELRPMGRYELHIVPDAPEGQRGTEGCRVLCFVPRTMLTFEWNFPPSIPALRDVGAHTQIVLHFDELDGGRVRVRLDQVGWQEGDDWDKGYAYFDKAWSWVLERLKAQFEAQAGEVQTWIDGAVTVSVQRVPFRQQVFTVDVPASGDVVWETMTTVEGVRSFLSSAPEVELAIGGAYALFPGSTQRVQAFVPQRMLVVTGSAPLEFPNVRMAGTWAVLEFEALNEANTRVRMTCAGWDEGEEWDRAFDYFLRNNPIFLNLLRQRFTEGRLEWTEHEDGPATFQRIAPDQPAGR